MRQDYQQKIRQFFVKGGNPATITLLLLYVVTWFLNAAMGPASPATLLAFASDQFPLPYFWTPLTWAAVAAGSPITLVFALLWAYWVYGSLERSWGTMNFLGFFFSTALITAITTWIGGKLLNVPFVLADPWVALAPTTVAWAMINRREQVGIFFGLAQVPAIWLAVFSAVVVWYFVGPPFLGLFALSGCAAAYWYVQHGRFNMDRILERQRIHRAAKRFAPEDRERVNKSFDPLAWWKERQQRKQLEEMFRRSGFGDEERSDRER